MKVCTFRGKYDPSNTSTISVIGRDKKWKVYMVGQFYCGSREFQSFLKWQ